MNGYSWALLGLTCAGAALAALTHDAVPMAWTIATGLALAAELHARWCERVPTCEVLYYVPDPIPKTELRR